MHSTLLSLAKKYELFSHPICSYAIGYDHHGDCIFRSGVDEEYSELEKLLIDVMERRDEAEANAIEKKTKKKKEKDDKNTQKLLKDGRLVRKRAMQTMTGKFCASRIKSLIPLSLSFLFC